MIFHRKIAETLPVSLPVGPVVDLTSSPVTVQAYGSFFSGLEDLASMPVKTGKHIPVWVSVDVVCSGGDEGIGRRDPVKKLLSGGILRAMVSHFPYIVIMIQICITHNDGLLNFC